MNVIKNVIISITMNRFENEIIFLDGEFQFVANVNKILDFQEKCLIIDNPKCCLLCTFRNRCINECSVDECHILVKIKYFELYKDWEKSINK